MIALNILDIRKFMSAFLGGSLLDDYTMIECQITTFCTFSIDGRLERAFYGERSENIEEDTEPLDEAEPAEGTAAVEYVRWQDVKTRCFDIIKGKRTPLFFKFVFFYPPEELENFIRKSGAAIRVSELAGLCLNLRYDGSSLTLTTGTSTRIFTMDRTIDRAWDDAVRELLIRNSILFSDV